MKANNAAQRTEGRKASFKDMVFAFIDKVSGNATQVSVHQEMIRFLGDPDMALFLCQLLYWADKTTNPKRMLYKSDRQWKEEIGLSKYTLMKARKHLKELGIITIELIPANGHATSHYKVNFEKFKTEFQKFLDRKKVKADTAIETELQPDVRTETESTDTDDFPEDVYSMAEGWDLDQVTTLEDFLLVSLHPSVRLMHPLFRLKTDKDHPELTLGEFCEQETQLPIISDCEKSFRVDDVKIINKMLLEYTQTEYDDPEAYTFQHFNRPEVKLPLYKKVIEQRNQKQKEERMEARNDSE